MSEGHLLDPIILEAYRRAAMQLKLDIEMARFTDGDITQEQMKDEINRFQDKIMKAEGEEVLVLYHQVMGLDD